MGGHIAISGYRSLSQSFGGTSFKFVMVDKPRLQLETNKFVVLLLKLVGAFYPQVQHVCVKIEAQYEG